MNWCILLMKFLKEHSGQGRGAAGGTEKGAPTFHLGLDLRQQVKVGQVMLINVLTGQSP